MQYLTPVNTRASHGFSLPFLVPIFGGSLGLLVFVAGMLAVAFGFLTHLESLPLQNWDETRNAQNVQSMLTTGDWWVIRMDGNPDLWNTKPPLLLWLQALFSKLLGPGLLALRLPSAFFAFALAWWMPWFTYRRLASVWMGWLAALMLVVSTGFNGFHVSRTGDFDAPLIACMIWSSAQWWLWCEDPRGHGSNKHLFGFVIASLFGFLFKGVAAFLFVPGWLIWAFLNKVSRVGFAKPQVWYAALCLLGVPLLYYAWKELVQPGYVEAVLQNEWLGRYSHVIEGHTGNFWFYWDWLFGSSAFPFSAILFPILLVLAFYKNRSQNAFAWFVWVVLSAYFLVISMGATKLFWYGAPLIPLLCLATAISLFGFCQEIQSRILVSFPLAFPFLAIVLLWFFWLPLWQKTLVRALDPYKGYGLQEQDQILNNLRWYQGRTDCDTIYIPHYGYVEGARWYNWVYEQRGGPKLYIKSFADANPGEVWAIPRVWVDSFALQWHWQQNRYLPVGDEVTLIYPFDSSHP
jgi:hypothetical protein